MPVKIYSNDVQNIYVGDDRSNDVLTIYVGSYRTDEDAFTIIVIVTDEYENFLVFSSLY